MLYASYAEGFKTGSWTTRLSNPLPEAPSFGLEEATTYELGVKTDLLNRRVRINAALFTTDYEGIQLNFQEGVSPTIRNAGDAEITGLDLDLQALIGERFSILAAFGWVDAEYTEVNPLVVGVTLDSRLPKTPETQFTVGPQYQHMFGNGGALLVNVDYSRISDLYNDTENTELLRRPSIDLVNASVTYRSPAGNWDFVVGGTNLTDERYLITGQAQIAGGQIFGTYSRPREWYASFRVRN